MAAWSPPQDWQTRPVTVLGGGVLGRRIAACWYAAGFDVIIRDPSAKSRDDALAYIKTNIGTYTALTNEASEQGKLSAVDNLAEAVKESWLIFEVAPEVLEIKTSIFDELEKASRPDAILATNSSSYKSGDLVGALKDSTKKRVLNTHYMMPPEALVVELMTDGYTYPELLTFVFDSHVNAGLHPILVRKPSTGFVLNRIWAAIKRETIAVLAEGVSVPKDLDSAFKETYGARYGPCEMMDQVGLDTVEHIEQHYIKERSLASTNIEWLHENFVVPGKLGKKSDKGGLYDKPKAGSQVKLFFLNLGVAEKLSNKLSYEQILHRGQVLSLNLSEGGKPTELVGHVNMPDGIAISRKQNRIYWTDMGNPSANDGTIWSANLDGSDAKIILSPGHVHTPKQCVIDEKSQKLYFSDREGLRVMRLGLEDNKLETIVETGNWVSDKEKAADQLNWCVGIAVSPKNGKFFWSQKGNSKANQGRIFSANIDFPSGTNATNRSDIELVAGKLPEPIDLELNSDESALFWTDRGELPLGNTLNKKTIVGQQPQSESVLGRQILAQGLGEGIGLTYDPIDNVIYTADLAGRIFRCNADKLSAKEKIYEGASAAFTGITLLHV